MNTVDIIRSVLQVIVGLGILNVWLVRRGKSTAYRGGGGKSLREEFAAYGLSSAAMVVVGTLKVSLALALLAGLVFPLLVDPAAIGLAVLMLGALAMHLKIGDPLIKSLPAISVLAMCLAIAVL